jgi:hypothetical protein
MHRKRISVIPIRNKGRRSNNSTDRELTESEQTIICSIIFYITCIFIGYGMSVFAKLLYALFSDMNNVVRICSMVVVSIIIIALFVNMIKDIRSMICDKKCEDV